METHRTIEKSKETIVKRPNKVMGPATGLYQPVEASPVGCHTREWWTY